MRKKISFFLNLFSILIIVLCCAMAQAESIAGKFEIVVEQDHGGGLLSYSFIVSYIQLGQYDQILLKDEAGRTLIDTSSSNSTSHREPDGTLTISQGGHHTVNSGRYSLEIWLDGAIESYDLPYEIQPQDIPDTSPTLVYPTHNLVTTDTEVNASWDAVETSPGYSNPYYSIDIESINYTNHEDVGDNLNAIFNLIPGSYTCRVGGKSTKEIALGDGFYFSYSKTGYRTIDFTLYFDGTLELQTYYLDSDDDGYGNPSVSVTSEIQPEGYVTNNTDCNDSDNTIFPGAIDIPGDSIDQNCDGNDAIALSEAAYIKNLSYPTGIAIDDYNSIYIAEFFNNRILKFNGANEMTVIADSGDGVIRPLGLTLDSAGNLYIANNNHSILKLNTFSGSVTTISSDLPIFLGDIALTPTGEIYVSEFDYDTFRNANANKVLKINPDSGEIISTYTVGSGPYGLLYHDNRMIVAHIHDHSLRSLDIDTGVVSNLHVQDNPVACLGDIVSTKGGCIISTEIIPGLNPPCDYCDEILQININSRDTKSILYDLRFTFGIAIDKNGENIFVTTFNGGEVLKISNFESNCDDEDIEWFKNPETGNYYSITPSVSWLSAREIAKERQGDLIIIDDEKENQWVVSAFGDVQNPNGYNSLHIGLSDNEEEGVWKWVDGSPLSYSNWEYSEPNNLVAPDCEIDCEENYAQIMNDNSVYSAGEWNDINEWELYPGVVERTTEPDNYEIIYSENIILFTDTENVANVKSGQTSFIYGNSGVNHVVLESAANVKLINFSGNNEVTIQSNSNLFSVSRSGASVTFEGTDGTSLKIPATKSTQKIIFDDITLDLVISGGQVLLGSQSITLADSDIEENLTANIAATPTSGPPPLTVSLSCTVQNGTPPYSFKWNFGDGSGESNEQNPTHTYETFATYIANVTVTDNVGQTNVQSIEISVQEESDTPCQEYEFGQSNLQEYIYSDGKTKTFDILNDMHVNSIEVVLDLAGDNSTLYIEFSINAQIIDSWSQNVTKVYTNYTHEIDVDLDLSVGDTIKYFIYGGTLGTPGGGLKGPNYIKLCETN